MSQFSEELVEIKFETNQLRSIKVYPNVDYLSQMLGGVAINEDEGHYIFTSEGGNNEILVVDIISGEILYSLEAPQIQMIQHVSDQEIIGLNKDNPSNKVAVSKINYATGEIINYPENVALEGIIIDTHNSAIDKAAGLFYFVGSFPGSNSWSLVSINFTDGSLKDIMPITPEGQYLSAIAFDKERQKIIGLLGLTPNGLSLIEIDPISQNLSEIKKIPEIENIFGGHRYWAYDDSNDHFFVIGHDGFNESYFYTLNSNNGEIIYQHLYDDDQWIMEEHSPLELRFNQLTNQLFGLRKGEPLAPLSSNEIDSKNSKINIYPNPQFNDELILMIDDDKILELMIVDPLGKIYLQQKTLNENILNLNTSMLPKGTFKIYLTTRKGATVKTWIKM